MRRFRRVLDDCRLEELHLHGKLYTWSNERRRPTLERLDRAFASVDWIEAFPHHHLRCLSSDCSDHSPLLLQLCTVPWAKPRFKFEAFWVKLEGFEEVVQQAWNVEVQDVDACRLLDQKLGNTAKELKRWSIQKIGSVRVELFRAREIVAQLEAAQDHRELTEGEVLMRKQLKQLSLGLASMSCLELSQGKELESGIWKRVMPTRSFLHLQACHRNRKNQIPPIMHNGSWFSSNSEKSQIIYEYYHEILGKPFQRQNSIDLSQLLPRLEMSGIDSCFSEQEVWDTIKEMPSDRAPGPDGFINGLFYKVAWQIIKADVLNAINALWSLD